MPAFLRGPIHYQVWWCHSGTSIHTYGLVHPLRHVDTHTQTWEERSSVTLCCTRSPQKYYLKQICIHIRPGCTAKYLHASWKNVNVDVTVMHIHVCASMFIYTHTHAHTQTFNEKQDSWECLARV